MTLTEHIQQIRTLIIAHPEAGNLPLRVVIVADPWMQVAEVKSICVVGANVVLHLDVGE